MLKNRSALITGASQGLGRVLTQAFLRDGANVTMVARNSEVLEKTALELKSQLQPQQQLLWFALDVTQESDLKKAIDASIEAFGSLEILVNNAGVYGPQGFLEDVSLEEWSRAIEINLLGTMIPMRVILPHLKQQRYGKIINLSGGGATKPMPRVSAYAASKAAVVRLTETIALEVEPYSIDVNAIAPGALNTRLLDEILAAGPEKIGDSAYQKALKQQKTGGDSLTNAADLCVFLASAKSDGVSGRLISAVWDHWETLPERKELLQNNDVYTLRRITDKDRGFSWDKD